MSMARWLRTSLATLAPSKAAQPRCRSLLRLCALEDRTTPATSGFLDSGFELPALTANSFRYNPSGSPWVFDGNSGVSTNKSGFTSGNANAPQGSQVAFLQRLGGVSQVATFEEGFYAINFRAAQRGNMASAQTFQVLIDGNLVGTFNGVTGSTFSAQSSTSFYISAGNHTVAFKGTNLNGGDNTVFIDQVSILEQATGLLDSGFEFPALSTGGYKYNPVGSAWTFTGASGLATNGSAFTAANPAAPQGNQVVFLQQKGGVSQVVNFNDGIYDLNFMAAQRASLNSKQTLQILLDGTPIATFNNVTGSQYRSLAASSFSVSAGSHTITFQGTNLSGGDNTIFVDDVVISPQYSGFNDSGFELPALSAGAFQYNPTGGAWAFNGNSGVASNGSGFTSGNPVAPQGSQVLFLQRLGNASQVTSLYSGTYVITFSAAQRGNGGGAQTFQVLVDGVVVGSFNNVSGTSYRELTTSSFVSAASNLTITFQGTNLKGGDNTVFIDAVSIIPQATALADSGFESPALLASGYQYAPAGSAWTFSGAAGFASNGSAFTKGNANAPQGSQVLFLQQKGGASQTVTFAAGVYSISFSAAQRGNVPSVQTYQVLVDGVVVGTFNSLTGITYSNQVTTLFSASTGQHAVTFQGTNLNGGDNTVFIDQIWINQQFTSLSDAGFESPALNPGTFAYNPGSAAWTFTGSAGLSSNGSGFTSGNANAPQGNQVAFVQGKGSVSQVFAAAAGDYSVSLLAAQRGNSPSAQTLQVLIDGVTVGTFNSHTSTSYGQLTTASFSLPAGNHTLTIRGTNINGGDNTMFIDQVEFNLL